MSRRLADSFSFRRAVPALLLAAATLLAPGALVAQDDGAPERCCAPPATVGGGGRAVEGDAPVPPPAPAPEAKPETKPEAPKWDVANPPGPAKDVEIDTDEGTWMSLDVSPDGAEIAFDLLGDIYSIPIAGGEAKPLATGVPWDMQPRYSPDGKKIAFTSDRAGGDNVWVMNRDGSDPKAVTKEAFRLLNSPAFSPDGEFIAARKHFTSGRSLGSGEIWLYHVSGSGSDGLQMTTKPNDQKDVGEPAFSPDGRYLYYSQDVTAGASFDYNKDPNGVIYAIQRLDRTTGESRTLLGAPGGSIRPTPSPDGKSLAFVRRVRLATVLFVRDLESGDERPLFDGLDRDMQETWAIHGVYPTMAWTPDSKSIVFWSGGKIRRVDVESRAVAEVPFHVKSTRRVADAVRFPQAVAPETFRPRMLRTVETAPDGSSVAYQALGKIWIRPLPDGAPRRLTAQNDHFEFFPAYSRDGQSIAYATWDDEALGSVRVAPVAGGEGRVVTGKPGHFVEPMFSPDGQTLVYRRVAGDGIFPQRYSGETGIFRIGIAGGEETRVARSGRSPQFGADGSRVYFVANEGEKRALKSVALTGAEERTHVTSENATEFRVSPDEKWFAFAERFNAYIAPLVRTGRAVDVSPKSAALPVRRVSRDAGRNLRFSGDSKRLSWSLGPELFSRDLAEAFAWVPGAPDPLPAPPETGIDLSFDQAFDAPAGAVALVGGRIVTMRGDEVIEDGTIIVQRNRIAVVDRRAAVAIPAGTHVVDVTGKTIIPGIVDVHAHGPQGGNGLTPERNWLHDATLAFGVTTVHDPSNDTESIFSASELVKAGLVTGPRIFSTGTILYGAAGDFKAEIDSLDDARSHLRRMKAVGAFSVKSYNQPRRDQRQQVIAAARELSMMVVPEGGSLFMHNMTMVVDGHTGVEHSIPVGAVYKDVLQFWPKTASYYTPTLVVGYGGIWGENYWYQHSNVWEHPRLTTFVPRDEVDPRSRRRMHVAEDDYNHFRNARICKQIVDAGGHVTVGAHGQREGLGAHWEIWMLAQGGLTPHQALRAATIEGAAYLGLDADLGTIEPGKLADLAILDKNPLENVRDSESVAYVMANGRLFDARTMDQIGNHPAPRPRPWFAGANSDGK